MLRTAAWPRRVNEHRAPHGRRQPFVGIDGDRIGAFDAVEQSPQAIRCQHRAAPGCIDVVPKTLPARDIGARVQRVDHAAAGGSRSGNDHHGDGARGAVLGNGAKQRLRIHPAQTVRIHQTQRGAADARLVRDLQPRNVTVA